MWSSTCRPAFPWESSPTVYSRSTFSTAGESGFGSSQVDFFSSSTCASSSILVSVFSTSYLEFLQQAVGSGSGMGGMTNVYAQRMMYRGLLPQSAAGVAFLRSLSEDARMCPGAFPSGSVSVLRMIQTSDSTSGDVPSCPILADFGPLNPTSPSSGCNPIFVLMSTTSDRSSGMVTGRCWLSSLPATLSPSTYAVAITRGLICLSIVFMLDYVLILFAFGLLFCFFSFSFSF